MRNPSGARPEGGVDDGPDTSHHAGLGADLDTDVEAHLADEGVATSDGLSSRAPHDAESLSAGPVAWVRADLSRRLGSLERPHLTVLAVLAVLGVVVAVVLAVRARPVPLAMAAPVTATPPTVGSPTPAPGTPSVTPTPVPQIVVHVIGAVRHPGLVTLDQGSRVADAIEAAGGTTPKARLGDLNLAQVLVDGQQVIIGHGEVASEVRGPTGSGAGPAGTPGQPSQPLNLNTATAEQLEQLPGVGPVTAEAIITWRTEHGGFTRVEELQEISGIGSKTYARLAPLVRV